MNAKPLDGNHAAQRRAEMVRLQIAARGVKDPRVLQAMHEVPREAFVASELADIAFDDGPLPIGDEQTISQPFIVALMAEALQLQGHERVLEIGTGSGYAAAVLSRLAAQVHTVERIRRLATLAANRLRETGCANVQVHHGDGTLGWAEHAPYDGIVVTAGGPRLPEALKAQLAPQGRLVMPVGSDPELQELVCVQRLSAPGEPPRFESRSLGGVRFVPLLGAQGWPE